MNHKYLTYDSAEMAADDLFVQWVRTDLGREQWESWLTQHPKKRAVVAEARDLVEQLQFQEPASATDKEDLWSRIQHSIREAEKAPARPGRRAFIFYLGAAAAAASVALLIFWGLNFLQKQSLQTPRGAHLVHALPDESRVTLNADSRIRYVERDWVDDRRLSLRGEAYFEIERGTPLVVQTPLGEVTVLGTTFNVYSRGAQFLVQCTSGRVRVTTAGDATGVILGGGESCRMTPAGKLVKQDFDTDLGVGWLQGIYRFDEQPLDLVFAELERQFDVRIQAPPTIRNQTYSGAFSGEDLGAALRDVCWPLKLVPERSGKTIIIRMESSE